MTIKAIMFHKPLMGLLLTGALVSQTALADEISTNAPINRFEQGYANHLTRVKQRLQQFRHQLDINASQESAWHRYQQEVLANVEQRHQQLVGAYRRPSDTAPQHFANIIQLRQDQLITLRKEANAFNTLYEVLTTTQKQQADQYFSAGKRHILDVPNRS